MTINLDTTTSSLITLLETTGFKFGDTEIPMPQPAAGEPYGIVYGIAGGTSHGSFANELDMATAMFQVTMVGYTAVQCRKLQAKVHAALATGWYSITGCLGPSRTSPGGIVKQDDRTFVCNDTIYMEVTG